MQGLEGASLCLISWYAGCILSWPIQRLAIRQLWSALCGVGAVVGWFYFV